MNTIHKLVLYAIFFGRIGRRKFFERKKNMKDTALKSLCAVIVSCAASYFNVIVVPLFVLLITMTVDYVTGMISAYVRHELSSKAGTVGIIIDYVCSSTLVSVGLEGTPVYFFGILVTIWLLLNELISILENLSEIGVPLPAFLTKIVERLKLGVEKNAE